MTVTDPTVIPQDFHRDQWGHPLIVPAGGDRPVAYVRASSAAKTVEDTYNLEMWARRNVVFGMARDKSLTARVLALAGDPSTWDLKTKKLCNTIHEDAQVIAKAHSAADTGTALHRMTEIVDRNQPLIAGPYEADIEAYVNALAAAGLGIDEGYIECRLVCDELRMAGSADRILLRSADHVHKIADIKTGETVDYGGLGWSAQLAVYAHGELYDVDTDQRLPTPAIDRTTGIIIHLPAGKGVCTLYEIDLVAGYRAAQLANEIRDIRREAKRWISPLAPVAQVVEAVERHPSNGRREQLLARYRALPLDDQEAYRARSVEASDLDAVEHALDDIEQAAARPPADGPPSPGAVVAELGRDHDEGETVPADVVAELRARYVALPDAMQFWLASIQAEANRAGVGFHLKGAPTWRRYWLYLGLIELAERGIDEPATVRDRVWSATGNEAVLFPSITVGHAVGAMGASEALEFADLCAKGAP